MSSLRPSIRITAAENNAIKVIKHVRLGLGVDLITAKGVVMDGHSINFLIEGSERDAFLAGLQNMGATWTLSETGDWFLMVDTDALGRLYFAKPGTYGTLWSTHRADAATMFKEVADKTIEAMRLTEVAFVDKIQVVLA